MYHAGGAGGILHTFVNGLKDILGPQSAELTPGVTTIAAATDTNATATTAAARDEQTASW